MRSEEQLLAGSIRSTLADASRCENNLLNISYGNTIDNVERGPHADELNIETDRIEYFISKAFRDVLILAERLGLPRYCDEIIKARDSFEGFGGMTPTQYDEPLVSEPLQKVKELFGSLESMTEGRAISGLGIFENILENTSNIINDYNVEPKNEAQVRELVRKVLSYSFRDVVKEMPVTKNLKTYKPDIGVRSLYAAAEYKFITTKADAKKCLDEIYADMKGYSGSFEWRSFYAVMYITEPFYTQADIDAEFSLVRAELSWKPIVVVGKGSRS